MAEPPSIWLQNMLKTAVQTVQWTYSLFWQMCPQQGMLVWGDGYYNGAIKTRKTVQPMEVSAEEASLQRSKQLMELYESLSAGDQSNHQTRRPCASLSPEDLTESEWFYLMCVSFSFPPGVGLPGKAYSKRKHVWLAGANEVDSKFFTRAILAKSADIQTVICIPLPDGVVELGTTERVQEDIRLVQQVKNIFIDHEPSPQPPNPAPSEHSTSNYAPPLQPMYPPAAAHQIHYEEGEEGEDGEEEEEDDEEEEEAEFDSIGRMTATQDLATAPLTTEPSELTMQLEMSEDIRLGSPDDECDFQLLAPSQANPEDGHPRDDSFRAESTRRWAPLEDPLRLLTSSLPPPPSEPGGFPTEELVQDDTHTHYSQTVSTVLQQQWSPPVLIAPNRMNYSQSAFSKWTVQSTDHHLLRVSGHGTSQWLLKYMLFSVPFLHTRCNDETSPKSRDASESASRFRKGTPQDDLSANHVLAERRRREKLNERFIVLRSLVPFVTKMDKASILGDTIEYLKQLRTKIQDLESRNRQMEIDRSRALPDPQRSDVTAVARLGGPSLGSDKKKLRIVEGTSSPKPKAVDLQLSPPPPSQLQPEEGVAVQVEVSIIETDALVELQCPYREGLLLDVMVVLRELRVEVTAVQSSLTSGVFVAELRAKVKENATGKKPSIMEVKKAVHQIIPQC